MASPFQAAFKKSWTSEDGCWNVKFLGEKLHGVKYTGKDGKEQAWRGSVTSNEAARSVSLEVAHASTDSKKSKKIKDHKDRPQWTLTWDQNFTQLKGKMNDQDVTLINIEPKDDDDLGF